MDFLESLLTVVPSAVCSVAVTTKFWIAAKKNSRLLPILTAPPMQCKVSSLNPHPDDLASQYSMGNINAIDCVALQKHSNTSLGDPMTLIPQKGRRQAGQTGCILRRQGCEPRRAPVFWVS